MAVVAGRGVGSGRAGTTNTNADDILSGSQSDNIARKEDLANFISMITRDETPFMASIGKTKATAIYHEWQTDELEAPGNSKIVEGTDFIVPGESGGGLVNPGQDLTNIGGRFAYVGTNRTRLGNYCQINGKTMAISGTRKVIDSVGVADEYAYQLKKKGTELKRDLEHDIIHTSQLASGSGQRTMGGYQAWINNPLTCELNGAVVVDSAGTAASDTGPRSTHYGTGRFSAVPVNSAKVSLSLSQIDQVMQNIYEQGGKAGKAMMSPKLRRDFSDLMVTDSGVRRNIDQDGKLRQSVDVYMSDFGDVMVIPNYIMGLSNNTDVRGTVVAGETKDSTVFMYDPMWFSIATLRPLQEVEIGQRGDSTLGMMVEECTMEVKNPVGCGAIYNLS